LTGASSALYAERMLAALATTASPFSDTHLRNMLRLRRAGAVIMPASPAFYSHPKDLTEMADSLVQRVLDHLEIDVPVFQLPTTPSVVGVAGRQVPVRLIMTS
jgi:3-polyprenyl-4-hydroxybenzoate decarboxylase